MRTGRPQNPPTTGRYARSGRTVQSMGATPTPTDPERRQRAAGHLLAEAALHVDQAEAGLRAAVALARSEGLSWQDVADQLGVSRQSAWQRFAGISLLPPENTVATG